ncbi:IS66 family transposase [Bacteroides intestinalis]|uniref:IS66 family transposase n=1 Tax=Bacteroides intestinalis TaxID=329854 RepID=UPI001E599E83|nr:transposase [Bacteroides intestinalis]
MQRALNYLHSLWKQLFNYRKNREYTIDNLAAEWAIRPLTVQRKKQLVLLQYPRSILGNL